jgi:hypothetical protein|nr:MAG TPA: hypothetical protein [Caudoviricetes sp.]
MKHIKLIKKICEAFLFFLMGNFKTRKRDKL